MQKKSKDMDIDKFRKDFESSGMTQRAYGKQIGMSSSMVHYYLRKCRDSQDSECDPINKFRPLQIEVKSTDRSIVISTSDGVQINIPI